MAIVSAPLLSFTARGQIAKTQVYSSWKGRPYVRRLVTPSNPRSTDQMTTRNTFTFLSNAWQIGPGDFRAPWTAYAKGLVMTDRNAFFSKNISTLRGQSDLDEGEDGDRLGVDVRTSHLFGEELPLESREPLVQLRLELREAAGHVLPTHPVISALAHFSTAKTRAKNLHKNTEQTYSI